jgi:hypothetical protein
MTEERKHVILLATAILTARRLSFLFEEVDRGGKPNMATDFWTEVSVKSGIERAAYILDKIDEKWPALVPEETKAIG